MVCAIPQGLAPRVDMPSATFLQCPGMAMYGQTPALGVIGDRISAVNGRAMFYTRFFDWCEARRLALDVFGDAPALDIRREHIRYWPCERVPGDRRARVPGRADHHVPRG